MKGYEVSFICRSRYQANQIKADIEGHYGYGVSIAQFRDKIYAWTHVMTKKQADDLAGDIRYHFSVTSVVDPFNKRRMAKLLMPIKPSR
jgi:hypothetical protein